MPTITKQQAPDWARISAASGHPLRLAILEVYDKAAKPMSPIQVTRVLEADYDIDVQNVSYHVRLLRGLGEIEMVSVAPRRGAVEHFYERCQDAPFKALQGALEAAATVVRVDGACAPPSTIEDLGEALAALADAQR